MSKPGTIRYANNACIRLTYLIIFLSYLLFIIIYMKYVWRWPKQTIFSLLSSKQRNFSHCQLLSLFVDAPQRQSLSGTQHNQMIMNSQIQSAQVFPVSSAIITRELTNKLSANSLLASFLLQIKVEITQAKSLHWQGVNITVAQSWPRMIICLSANRSQSQHCSLLKVGYTCNNDFQTRFYLVTLIIPILQSRLSRFTQLIGSAGVIVLGNQRGNGALTLFSPIILKPQAIYL